MLSKTGSLVRKSKLIIFFITKTPIDIHTAQHAIMKRPV